MPLPLPPVPQPKPATDGDAAVLPRRSAGIAFSFWLRKLWPAADRHLASDVTIPGKAERRISLRLAAVAVVAAVVSVAPVFVSGHTNLLAAPPWALAAVFLAVLQLVFAAWVINAPDWASARVQMVLCAVLATLYAMLMTLTLITPPNYPLLLGLGEVRHAAPGWCGLMFVVMGAATWFCGWTSAKWRRSLVPRSQE